MRFGVGCAILATLCACNGRSREVQACESLLLPSLKAPSTYKLVDATALKTKSGVTDVFIQYDAVNSYNAPIRGTFACKVDVAGVASSMEADVDRDLEEAIRSTARSSDKPVDQTEPERATDLDEVPVCDRDDSPEKRALMNEIGTDCMGE